MQTLAAAAADTSFASSIIAAINTAATSSGFGNVVLSTPADVMATITVPDTVSITLPPAPTPPCVHTVCVPYSYLRLSLLKLVLVLQDPSSSGCACGRRAD